MNRSYWNIVKGIGISCVVFGHVCSNFPKATQFVYLFHLALFFFTSGFLWNEEKYGDSPFLNFAARMKNTWFRYFSASLVFVLLHNWFLEIGVLINQDKYTGHQLIISLVTSFMLNCTETMSSSLWFVPLLIISSTIFSAVIMLGRSIERAFGGGQLSLLGKYTVIILLGGLSGWLGVYATSRGWGFHYNMQIAFLVVPIFIAAYFARKFVPNVEKYIQWYVAIPLLALLIYGVKILNWQITLSNNIICGPYLFYVLSFAGIYVSLFVASWINKNKRLRQIFAFLGQHSFEIMAWHLLVVKLIDIGYAKLVGETDIQIYGAFTNAYAAILWPIYLIVGTLLPAVCTQFIKKLTEKVCFPQLGEK